jgi:hypothetical protein
MIDDDSFILSEAEKKFWEERLAKSIQEFTYIFTSMQKYPDDGDGQGGAWWVRLLENVLRANPHLQKPNNKKQLYSLSGNRFNHYLTMAQEEIDKSVSETK